MNSVKMWVMNFILSISVLAPTLAQENSNHTTDDSRDNEIIRFVPFDQVRLEDSIWRPRIKKLVKETLPHAFKQTEVAQRRLELCAKWLESGGKTEKPAPHRFNTSDLYKVMEGAALMIKAEPNPKIEAQMDRIIDIIARAQQKDGYLYVSHITGNIRENEMGKTPYSYVLHSHELYNVGHLYEAAVAYAQATGKEKLLKVAEKNARHVNRVFFQGDPKYNFGRPVMQAPGHQEIEIGLVKLFHYTGNDLYLKMAERFLKIRGVTYKPNGTGVSSPTYAQQHLPVSRQKEAVGHAVRATYQYAAMAEIDSLLRKDQFSESLDSIWQNITDKRMHITGGLGAVHGIEGFGPNYELPNKEAYLETCAAVGNVFFNMRMFLNKKDAKYLDVAEIALLNNCLSGIGLDGKSFFYPNPLQADQGHRPRSGWFGTACCPSNIARLIPQVSGYMYATDKDGLYVALFANNHTQVKITGTTVNIRQTTSYPWDEDIRIHLDPEKPVRFSLKIRIPSWVKSKLVPGDLYSYRRDIGSWKLLINGKEVKAKVENGFAVVDREWKKGDQVDLRLSMPVRVNVCNEKVEANRDRIAISKGPIIFCAEGVDNRGSVERFFVNVDTQETRLSKQQSIVHRISTGELKGLPQISIPTTELIEKEKTKPTMLKMIPYFAWSNRDRSSMITWLATKRELAKVDLSHPKNLKFHSVRASHTFRGDTLKAIRMKQEPKSSFDRTIRRWTSWPQKGRQQWVEVAFNEARSVKSIGVYFYDDKGGVQVPKDWWIEIPGEDGKTFEKLKIYNTDQFSCLKDSYNSVQPAGRTIFKKFRIVMNPQHNQTCVGILSVDVQFGKNIEKEVQEKKSQKSNIGNDDKVFLLPYFLGNGETGVYMTYSYDGLKFQWLGDKKPVMKAPKWPGENLTRDPSILFHAGKFHMVWTTSWNSRSIGYAWSENLKDWSEPKKIDIWKGRTDIKKHLGS